MRKAAAHFGIPWRGYQLIGMAELAAAAGVLAGLWWHWLGLAAASGMTLLLIGALASHRRAGDSIKETTAAVVALPGELAIVRATGQYVGTEGTSARTQRT
jgi:hypothetical protein